MSQIPAIALLSPPLRLFLVVVYPNLKKTCQETETLSRDTVEVPKRRNFNEWRPNDVKLPVINRFWAKLQHLHYFNSFNATFGGNLITYPQETMPRDTMKAFWVSKRRNFNRGRHDDINNYPFKPFLSQIPAIALV